MKYAEIESLLKFMYQGEININQEDLSTFLKVAQTLQIRGLTTEDTSSTFVNYDQLDADSFTENTVQSNLTSINEISKDVNIIDRRKRSRDITKKGCKKKKQDTLLTSENIHDASNKKVNNDNQEVLFLMNNENNDTNDIIDEEENISTIKSNNNDKNEDTTLVYYPFPLDIENSQENSTEQGKKMSNLRLKDLQIIYNKLNNNML